MAVERDGETVSRVFARAPYFKVLEDGREIELVPNPYVNDFPAGPKAVELVARYEPDVVEAGGFGAISRRLLEERAIKIKVVPTEVRTEMGVRVLDRIRERPLIRRIRSRFPFLQVVGVTPETLTPAQRELMEKFRRGIADALGVPPEAIREDVLARWVVEWSKAFVKPEYWAQAGITW